MDRIKLVAKSIIYPLIGIILGYLVLSAVFFVPIDDEKRDETNTTINREGWYPQMPVLSNAYNEYFASFLPGVLDGVTVRLMMNITQADAGESPFITSVMIYPRYWHGYAVILRPLLHFISYENIQVMNYALQLLLVFWLCMIMAKKKGMKYSVALICGYCLLMPMALFICPQYWTITYPTYISGIILANHAEWFKEKHRLYFFFMWVGIITTYLDLLTFPLLTWGIPLLIWLVLDDEGKEKLYYIKRVVFTGIGWIIGYGVMWAGKWVISSIVLKQNIILDAINEIFLRVGAQYERNAFNRFSAIYNCWKHYGYVVYAWIIGIWFVWWLFNWLVKGLKKDNKTFALLLVGLGTFAWYIAVYEHSLTHHLFEHKTFNVMITAAMFMMIRSVPEGKFKPESFKLKRVISLLVLYGLCGVLGIGLAKTAREKNMIYNAENSYDEYVFNEGEKLEFQFTPSFDKIADLGIGLYSENPDLVYRISLSYMGQELDHIDIPISAYHGTNYEVYTVDWKVTPGETYVIGVEPSDYSMPITYYASKEGIHLLGETGDLFVNGSYIEGETLMKVFYWSPVQDRNFKIFLAMSWMMVLTGLAYLFIPYVAENVDEEDEEDSSDEVDE